MKFEYWFSIGWAMLVSGVVYLLHRRSVDRNKLNSVTELLELEKKKQEIKEGAFRAKLSTLVMRANERFRQRKNRGEGDPEQ